MSNGEAMSLIYYPIPQSIIEKIPTLFKKTSHVKKAFEFIHFYCKMKVTANSKIPFLAYQTIHSDNFEPWRSKMGRMVKAMMIETFFDTIPHIPEVMSKGYRIKFKYLYSEYKEFPILDIDYSQKIELEPNEEVSSIEPETYSFLSKIDFEDCTLYNSKLNENLEQRSKNDIEGMLLRIDKPNGNIKVKVCSKSKLRLGRSSYTTHNPEKFQFILSLEKILLLNQKKYFIAKIGLRPIEISIDKSGFRLHHNLTNMPSEIINHIKFEGENVREIDLRNCHYTLFSNLLLNDTHRVFKFIDEALNRELATIMDNITEEECANIYGIEWLNLLAPEMLSSILTTSYISSLDKEKFQDLALFCKLSFDGLLYEGLSQIFWGEISPVNRSKAKIVLMEIFYGGATTNVDGSDRNCSELTALFKAYFPSVCKITDGIKNYTYANWSNIKDYELLKGIRHSVENKNTRNNFQASKSVLSLLLQLVETELFIGVILPNLRKEGFKVITKHDSIMTKESEYDSVKEKMNEVINTTFLRDKYLLK